MKAEQCRLIETGAQRIHEVADHEVKGLTLLALAKTCLYMSGGDIAKVLFSGLEEEGLLEQDLLPKPTSLVSFCAGTLEGNAHVRVGYSLRGVKKPREVQTYQIREKGLTQGVRIVDWMLGWSLKWPDVSVQQIFTGEKSASTRMKILSRLMDGNDAAGLDGRELKGLRDGNIITETGLNPEHTEAIADLLELTIKIGERDDKAWSSEAAAPQLIDDPYAKSDLMFKARRFTTRGRSPLRF